MSNSLLSASHYLVEREALFIRIDMSGYLIDYYLHRRNHAPNTNADHDQKLKELIACFAVHLTVHPSPESHAWTVHMVAEEPYSLFATGSAGELDEGGAAHGFIVGHVLTEHIRHTDVNSFHAQFTNRKGQMFKSFVKCESSDIPVMVEYLYQQSEQLPLRIQLSSTSDTAVAVAALPGYDEEWFLSVNLEALSVDQSLQKKQMRTYEFAFSCECSPEKLLPFFRSLSSDALDELYGKDGEINISCPRCGKQFALRRAQIEIGSS